MDFGLCPGGSGPKGKAWVRMSGGFEGGGGEVFLVVVMRHWVGGVSKRRRAYCLLEQPHPNRSPASTDFASLVPRRTYHVAVARDQAGPLQFLSAKSEATPLRPTYLAIDYGEMLGHSR